MNVPYAFRTLLGVKFLPALFVLDAAAFASFGLTWRGDGIWTVDWASGSLWIVGSLLAAVVAVDAARLSRPGSIHLVVGAPGRQRALVAAVLWCAGPLVVFHLALVVLGLSVGAVTRPSAGSGPLAAAMVVQGLAIVWCAALGSAIGRYLSPIVAGLAGAVVTFVAFSRLGDQASFFAGWFGLLEMGAGGTPRIGYGYNLAYLAAQAVIFTSTGAVLLYLGLRERSGRAMPTLAGSAQAVAVVAVILLAIPILPGDRYVRDPSPPAQCSDTTPVVCTYWEHRHLHDELVAKVTHLSNAAVDAGYGSLVPQAVHEESRTYWPDSYDVRGFKAPFSAMAGHDIGWENLVYQLVEPIHCDQLRGEIGPSSEYRQDRNSVEWTWLNIASVPIDVESEYYPGPVAELLTAEQVEQIVDRFARCDWS